MFDILSGGNCEPKPIEELQWEFLEGLPMSEPSDHRVPVSLQLRCFVG